MVTILLDFEPEIITNYILKQISKLSSIYNLHFLLCLKGKGEVVVQTTLTVMVIVLIHGGLQKCWLLFLVCWGSTLNDASWPTAQPGGFHGNTTAKFCQQGVVCGVYFGCVCVSISFFK